MAATRPFSVLRVPARLLIVSVLCLGPCLGGQDCPNLDVTGVWSNGLDSYLYFVLDHDTHGWEVNLLYDRRVDTLDCYQASVETTDHQHFRLTSLGWDDEYESGTSIQLHLMPHFSAGRPFLQQADIDGQDICGFSTTSKPTTTSPPPPPPTTTTVLPTTTTPEPNECNEVLFIEATDGPETIVEVHLVPTVSIYQWVVELQFKAPIRDIITSSAVVTGAGTGWRLENNPGEGSVQPGQKVTLKLVVLHTDPWMPGIQGVSFNGRTVCGDVPSF